MAVVEVTVEKPTSSGTSLTMQPMSTGNDYYVRDNDGTIYLWWRTTGAIAFDVTVETPGEVDCNPIDDKVYSVTANNIWGTIAGPFSPRVFNDANGDLKFTTDATSVTMFAAFRFARS